MKVLQEMKGSIPDGKSVPFESPSHTLLLLKGLNILKNKGLLLDVTLIAGGQAFKAHRVVLASCSEYFRAMFTDAMIERTMTEIYLNGVTTQGLRLILEYAYTSRLVLSLDNIQDVLSAASHLQLIPVVETCSQFLQLHLDLENCIDIATISETYSLHQLRKSVYQFICANLSKFSQTPEFKRLTLSQFEYILSCDYPVNCPEAEVLSSLVEWIKFDKRNRIYNAKFLFSHIHFNQLSSECIAKFCESKIYAELCKNLSQMNIADLSNLELNTFLPDKQCSPDSDAVLVNTRGMELALLKVGGFSISGITNEITYYLQSVGKWRYLTSIPHVDQCNFGTTVYNNELYVIGGCFNQSLQENIHPFGFVYNAASSCWSTISPMLNERCRFSLVVIDGLIYAVGGVGESSENESFLEENSPCEVYNPNDDTWSQIAPLPSCRSQHAGCSWNLFLFVSGGLDHDYVLNTCYRFDILSNRWEERQAMLTPRADHTMITYNDKIYVCGGWHEDESTGTRSLCDTIDCYDVENDEWIVETKVPTPRYHAGIVIMEGIIYLMGGFHSDATFDRASGVIECYNIVTKRWQTMDKYPHEVWEHSCCALYVPTCREDLDVIANVQS